MSIIKELGNDESIVSTLNACLESIPYKYLILWTPQLIKIAETNDKVSHVVAKILAKLAMLFPEIYFFTFKPLFKNTQQSDQSLRSLKDTYLHMKKSSYNIVTKL